MFLKKRRGVGPSDISNVFKGTKLKTCNDSAEQKKRQF